MIIGKGIFAGGGGASGTYTASSSDVLAGKTFYGADGDGVGAVPSQAGGVITPSTQPQTAIPAGTYALDGITVAGDANLVPANIRSGISIFGVQGSYFVPDLDPRKCLVFSSSAPFSLSVPNGKAWNGVMEWTNGEIPWTVWNGESVSSGSANLLFLRGRGNSVVSGKQRDSTAYESHNFAIDAQAGVFCEGNIENILDWQTVAGGNHPTMGEFCFFGLFGNCTQLVKGPDTPAVTLSKFCYHNMYTGCTGLTETSALPATVLKEFCYEGMYQNCTSLVKVNPISLVTVQAIGACGSMFKGCTALEWLPALLVLDMKYDCYQEMFSGCTAIRLSTSMTSQCPYPWRLPMGGNGTLTPPSGYQSPVYNMFKDCTGVPANLREEIPINTTYYTNHPPAA